MDVSLPHAERALIAEAERLGAALRQRSAEIAAARRLPADVVRALGQARLFALCVPRSLGGPEARVETLVRAVEAVAWGDSAAGWCVAIAATSGLLSAYLPAQAAQEVFGAPDAVAGGVFAPRGRAVRTPEGYRVTGRWSFASGCQHCTWLMGGCSVEEAGGLARLPGGRPDVRLFLFPASSARIHDTWDVAGLEGTGSHDIAVEGLLVPGSHAVSLISDRPREPGPLYAFPAFGLLAVGVAGVALGIGRRALAEIRELAVRKTPVLATRRLAERPATQARLAEAEATLGAARAYLLDTVREVWEEAASGGALDTQARARVRLAASWAVRAATHAVDSAYALGGGSAIYRSSPLQRLFRDVHTVTAHVMVSEPSFELVGRVLLGVDVDTSML